MVLRGHDQGESSWVSNHENFALSLFRQRPSASQLTDIFKDCPKLTGAKLFNQTVCQSLQRR